MLSHKLSTLLGAGIIATATFFVGLPTEKAVAQEELTIKIANVMGPSHDTSKAIDKFVELLAEKSDGRIKAQHFPGGQLGSDKETYESSQQGLLQFAGGSFANLVTITRAFEVFHLPFIFENLEQAHKAMDSKVVRDQVNAELEKVGMRWLMSLDFGFRDINTTDRQVKKPEDVAGLKLRASRSPTEIAGIEAFGAAAVTVDWPEVYNALKFGIVDGEAQPYGTMVSAKHEEIIKETLDLDWQYYSFVLMTSTNVWNGFPEWAHPIIEEAAKEAEDYHRKIWVEEDAKAREIYVEAGGKTTTLSPEERAEWVELGRKTWEKSDVSQDVIDVVLSEASN